MLSVGGAAGIHRPNAAYPFTCHLLAEFTGSNSHLPDVSSLFTAEPSHDQRTGRSTIGRLGNCILQMYLLMTLLILKRTCANCIIWNLELGTFINAYILI